jgi:hypothetical protein
LHSSKIEGIPLFLCTDRDGRYPSMLSIKSIAESWNFSIVKELFKEKRYLGRYGIETMM